MRADNLLMAQHWANVLRAAGIACELRNTALAGAIGDIPFLDAAPQVWVAAAEAARARQLLDEAARPPAGVAWSCARCGEVSEPQFGSCWNCGTLRSDGAR